MAGTIKTGGAPITETHRVIYRIDTGTIVAIETVWAEEGSEVERTESASQHFGSIMRGIAPRAGPLAVLEVKAPPAGAMHVDLATRTLIGVQQGIPEELAEPDVFQRP
jgi:hypothetical protein